MQSFNIEDYLDSLPEDIETIDVSNKNLTYLPSLKRFYKLKVLNCPHNQLTMLPELNDSLQELYCSNNQLIILPELNYSLQDLYCHNNQLTVLPELNDSLQLLNCSNNQLTMLPELNDSLQVLTCSNNQLTMLPQFNHFLIYLDCYNNQLTMLPELNNCLQGLYCENNQLTMLSELNDSLHTLYCDNNQLPNKLINNGHLTSERKNEINNCTQLLKRVTFTIMCLKYKIKFHDWLWIKVRLPNIQTKYHPNKLFELLKNVKENDEEAFCNAIEKW